MWKNNVVFVENMCIKQMLFFLRNNVEVVTLVHNKYEVL